MRPESTTEQRAAEAGTGTADSAPDAVQTVETDAGLVRIPPKPTRPPRRRAPKLDELLAGAVDTARTALTETGLAEGEQVGSHVSAVADDDRLVTHRFAATLPGYGGWEWFATLARAPRSKVVTVCEVGLLPGKDAILAPDWVPWSERVSQEEKIRLDAIAAGEDPEKALARARSEHDQESDPAQEDGAAADQGATADATDEGSDPADVDAGSDAADPDAGDEPGGEVQSS